MNNKYEFKLNPHEANDSHMGLARRIKRGESILELGCSSGYLSRFLKQDLGCYVVGIDIDPQALAQAAEFCDLALVADLDHDAWLQQIAGERFDTILCADVLEHLKNPAAVLKNLQPFLKPNGRVLASIPNVAHASIRLELLQGHFDYERLGILDDTHLHFYTLDGCIGMLMQAGYLCQDVAYSIHDIADEVIVEHLQHVGLEASAACRQLLHQPEATAFQFILEARPAAPELLRHKPPALTPKPLVSSGAFYSLKQEAIEELERQVKLLQQDRERVVSELNAQSVHNENHLKNITALQEQVMVLQKQRDAEQVHNQNHAKSIRAFEQRVHALELERDAEKIHNKNHQLNIKELEKSLAVIETQLLVAQQGLDAEKVHNANHLQNIKALRLKVEALEQERDAEKTHNLNHQKNIKAFEQKVAALELERDAEKIHNLNHQQNIAAWEQTGRILDEGLFDLTLRLEGLENQKQQLIAQFDGEREHFVHLLAAKEHQIAELHTQLQGLNSEVERLEAVLQRVHNKISYRTVRFLKDTPRKLASSVARRSSKHDFDAHQATDSFQSAPLEDNYNVHDYSAWLARYGDIGHKLSEYQATCQAWKQAPKIAVLMPVYNPTQSCLVEAIESVLAQVYPHWELCIADDASTEAYVAVVLQRYAAQDQRIKVMRRTENGHISKASNSALELVTADYVALMDHDDVLTPDALFWVAQTIIEHPDVQLIYSDEDKLTDQGQRYGAYFKPDWNPELLLSHNFICHLGVYRTQRVRSLGGFDPAFDGAQDYDLALRYSAALASNEIQHIPRILYHWRATPGSTANGIHEKPYAEPLIRQAVEKSLAAKGVAAEVMAHPRLPGALRVRYKLPKELPLVSMIIPTRNGFSLLKRCVDSILDRTDYPNFEVIIIDNGSDDWIVQRYLDYLKTDARITVLHDDSPFNYAALNNKAAALAKGELLALLNNDLEVINSDWLSEMVSIAVHPEVGAVGAKLYYPNDLIQHAGVIVGLGGVAGHSHKHFPRDNPGYCGRLWLTQNLSAVTAACLLLRKSVFEQVQGLDAENLKVAFNDVDFCLRIKEAGFWNVWTPYAELYHYESATRGYEDTPEKQARFTSEVEYMKQRWGASLLIDPAYNPNLTLDREDFSFAFPPRV